MKRKYLILFSLSGLVLCLDQLTKQLMQRIPASELPREWIRGLVTLRITQNMGFGFGMLQRAPESIKEIFFIGVPVFALILIVLIFIKLRDDQMLSSVALTTILGGAVGNLVDRIQHGFVIDILQLHWFDRASLPPFNVADCSIVVGVLLMFYNTWRQDQGAILPANQ